MLSHLISTSTKTKTGHTQVTASLLGTMALLNLTLEEFRQTIDAALSENPALEIVSERRCPTCRRLLSGNDICQVCSRRQTKNAEEPVVFVSPRDDFYTRSDMSKDDMPEDNVAPEVEELPAYVLRQIAPDLNVEDRKLAVYLLTHLDEDGLLTTDLYEIARYFHIAISRVAQVQHIIQRAEPVGVGSISPQESLLVQLEMLSETGNVPEHAIRVIQDGWDLFSHRHYVELAKQFGVPLSGIQKAVEFINKNLAPYPARMHWGDARQPVSSRLFTYHQPDILINYLNDDPKNPLVVEIVMPIGGTLQVNPMFKKALQDASEEKKEMWRAEIEKASLLVKCIQQRNNTMLRLMQRVASIQRDYILSGEKYLKPVTRVLLSKELGVHESTISRAVSNKTVQLPNRRIVPLSSFFDRNLNVRKVLCGLVEDEKRPLSDTDLAKLLSQQGFDVARRTVAKYRAMEGILPAHLRKVTPINI